MLHIVLGLLKIIGIIIAVILGVALLIICAVLFELYFAVQQCTCAEFVSSDSGKQ